MKGTGARKVPINIENPIDNLLLPLCDILCPVAKRLNMTPNGITTLSAVTGGMGLYYYSHGRSLLAGIFIFLSYFFDCMDGHYARMYNMITKFGDYYDHIKDAIVYFGFMYLLHQGHSHRASYPYVLLGFAALLLGCGWHLGCMEKTKKNSEYLSGLMPLCSDVNQISLARWLGCGTFNAYFIGVALLY